MDRSRPDQLLETWDAVASSAVRPATPPRRTVVRSSLPGLSLAGAAVLVGALILGVMWLGGPGSDPRIGGVTSPDPTSTPTATAEPTAVPSSTPAPSETPSPTPSPSPTLAPENAFGTCAVDDLTARITAWEGAAGSRIATVELTHTGATKCWLPSEPRVQLVDADGKVLIVSGEPLGDVKQSIAADEQVTTMVRTSNYCGADPTAPVTIAFVTPEGGTVIAAPLSPTDATVPPCNGPGQPGTIEMQPWTD